jgi:peptidoglycan hydrolase CwlO-like protein
MLKRKSFISLLIQLEKGVKKLKISKKSRLIISIILVSALIISEISLTLVQGDKPEDPGQPPEGLLSEIYADLDALEAELAALQDQLNTMITTDLSDLQAQIDDIGFDIGVLFNSVNSANDQISLIWSDIDTNIHPRINELYEHITQIYNEFHILRTEELIEIWNQIESDRENLYATINSVAADLENQIQLLGDAMAWQVADIRELINFIDSDIRSDIDMVLNGIQELWNHIGNVEANLQTQINEMNAVVWDNRDRINGLQGRIDSHDEDIDGLLNHVNTVDNHLQNQIDDLNVRTPRQCRISIPAASFIPVDDTQNLRNHGHKLENFDYTYASVALAGVQLPDNVIVTRVVAYFYNNGSLPLPAVLVLYQNHPNIYPPGSESEGYNELATLTSADDGFNEKWYYLNHRVNNYYSYYLALTIPPRTRSPDPATRSYFSQATIYYEYIT